MAGSITVGGNKIFEHTGATGSGVVQMLDQNGNPIITDTGSTVTIDNVGFGNSTSFPLSGRNLIINGDFRVNQRVAASRTENTNAYNYDRWYYDGTYLYQVIEDLNIVNGDYTISWSGSGLTAGWVISSNTTSSIPTVFTAITSGSSFTVSGKTTGDHLWIRFGGTLANLADVQVEEGTVATPFERRFIGTELALCQRYYQKSYPQATVPGSAIPGNTGLQFSFGTQGTGIVGSYVVFPVVMQTSPTLVVYDIEGNSGKATILTTGASFTNNVTINTANATETRMMVRVYNSSAAGMSFQYEVDAEL